MLSLISVAVARPAFPTNCLKTAAQFSATCKAHAVRKRRLLAEHIDKSSAHRRRLQNGDCASVEEDECSDQHRPLGKKHRDELPPSVAPDIPKQEGEPRHDERTTPKPRQSTRLRRMTARLSSNTRPIRNRSARSSWAADTRYIPPRHLYENISASSLTLVPSLTWRNST